MSSQLLKGKVALVTGGGSGIGRATCQILAREGATVVSCDVNLTGAQQTIESLSDPSRHLALLLDVSKSEAVDGAISAIIQKYKAPPTLLVNCAGIACISPMKSLEESKFLKCLQVNLIGTFLVSKAVAKAMESHGLRGGSFVNIASNTGIKGMKDSSAYAASKGGVIAFTKTIAKELVGDGIRVNCILPGPINTEMVRGAEKTNPEMFKAVMQKVAEEAPLGRMGEPEGGGSGMGRATCQILAREGATVVSCDINLTGAQQTIASLSVPSNHLALLVDVSKSESVDGAISAIVQKYKAPPTLLVNCAGIVYFTPLKSTEESDFMKLIQVNLIGTFLTCKAVAKAMESHGLRGGSFVNFASNAGTMGMKDSCAYSATKGGVIAFTKTIAKELVGDGIRVNCILPGPINTEMVRGASEANPEILNALLEHIAKTSPIGRLGEPEEVAETVAFLLSERSSYYIGACIAVDGGFVM